jgi:hypothetical protein
MTRPRACKQCGAPLGPDRILAQIDEEIARLERVRSMLATSSKAASDATGRNTKKAPTPSPTQKRRFLNPEARKRIADAQRKRWTTRRYVSILPDEPFPPLEPEKPKPTKARKTSASYWATEQLGR